MRSTGALGMSVGTSLAFESDAASLIRNSDTVLLNLMTLIRNAYDAYETKEEKDQLTSDQLVEAVTSDLKILAKWMEEARKSKPVELVVYYPTYTGLKTRFRHADLKLPTTKNQIRYDTLSKETAKKLYTKYEKLLSKTDVGMPEFKGRGIVLTHHVVDLAVSNSVGRLILLESYTGKTKPFTQWYTKLTGGEDLFYMPFNRFTIQIFGDRSTNFMSSSTGIKELVKKLALDNKWTSATTLGRIRSHINNLPQGVDRAGLQLMLNG